MANQPDDSTDRFPILDEELLLSLPKSAKTQDMDRIYKSPNSEDWVTWNILRALQRTKGSDWWEGVVAAAKADAGPSPRWASLQDPPSVDLWRTVESPPSYEIASRTRMRLSDKEDWRRRADNPRAVEGPTEVDLVFEGDDYLIFVEAKLHSDISTGTTYDPNRNQIARNIDCLIEQARGREPFFWMFVADRLPTRGYANLIALYRSNPEELHQLLPHRDPGLIDRILENVAVVTWDDLVPLIRDDDQTHQVLGEIRRRLGSVDDVSERSPVDERLKAILPDASWEGVDPSLGSSQLWANAAKTIRVDRMPRRAIGDIVHGMNALGNAQPNPENVPAVVRWRVLPSLPKEWSSIARITVGEILSREGVGVGKVQRLLAYIAELVHESPVAHPPADPDTPSKQATSSEVTAALRQVAAWGVAVGHSNLVDAIAEAAEGRSDIPNSALSTLDTVNLESFAGADLVAMWDPVSSAQRLIESFDERESTIMRRRILPLERSGRATLQELADEFGVSRERIRQVETGVTQKLVGALSRDGFRVINGVARGIRDAIGVASPLSEAPSIVQPNESSLTDELMLWYAGPYSIEGRWLVKAEHTLAEIAAAAFDRVASDDIADATAVEDELIVLGVPPDHAAFLLADSDLLQSYGDKLYRRRATTGRRAKIHLKLTGRPMTLDELFALDPHVDNIQSFRNAVYPAPGIVRVGPQRVALAEWDETEYPGMVPAMLDAIDAAGGSVAVDDLAADLADRFGVSEVSVRMQASMHPVFITESGRVLRRPANRPYEPKTNLEATRDCFVVNGAWALRMQVNQDVLRGSGRQIPEAFALYLGIHPLKVETLRAPVRDIHASWQQYPAIGSIRLNILDMGLSDGDYVFLRRSKDGSIELVGLPALEAADRTDETLLRLLVGAIDPADSRPWPYVVAEALGFGLATTPSIEYLKRRLRDRGQDDLLAAIETIESPTEGTTPDLSEGMR